MEKNKISLSSEKYDYGNSDKFHKKEDDSIENRLFLVRIIINIIFSLILIATFCLLWTSYSPVWKIFFFLTIWSFWSNTFYIITITVIDLLLYKNYKKCEKFNSFIRNDLIRIIFPFSISTIVIYWELVLLGDKFQGIGHSMLDICKSFFLHGLVLVFMCFDVFSSKHINKKNNCSKDIIIISIIMAIHFAVVIFCKEVLNTHSYDFLIIADARQIIASFIIIYLLVLNGYIVFYLISDNFFLKEEIEENYNKNFKEGGSGDKLKDSEDKDDLTFAKLNAFTNRKYKKYLKSEQNKIKNYDENIKEEMKKESYEEEKKEENKSNTKEENKSNENENYDISEKESNKIDVFEKKMENYAAEFFNVNTLNQITKVKEDREMLNLKKTKLGIKNIKIPQDTIVPSEKKE